MKIKSIHIENFRSIADQTIPLENFTCFVGSNGAGKSNVLAALNLFFRNFSGNTNIEKITDEDFHNKNTISEIKVGVTFHRLSPAAQEDFKAYVRQNELTVYSKVKHNQETGDFEYHHYGSRKVIKSFSGFFEKLNSGGKVTELKEEFDKVSKIFPDIRLAKTKDDMSDSLRSFEEAHPEKCEYVEGKEQFYGWSKGTNRLDKYIQWVFVPAVKDASQEKDENKSSALGQLLQRTIRQKLDFSEELKALTDKTVNEYQAILEKKNHLLSEVSTSIEKRLREWSHKNSSLNIKWNAEDKKSVQISEPNAGFKLGEGSFIGDVSRLGHGLQRSFILALLQELSESNSEDNQILILGFEEPELYQHPPQIRHMQNVLQSLSEKENQVFITTHSPLLIPTEKYECIRRIFKSGEKTHFEKTSLERIREMLALSLGETPETPTSILAKICQIMLPTLNEIYFSKMVILVEGVEDLAYLSSMIVLENKYEIFRNSGCSIVVCGGKTNISRPLAICIQLGIPCLVMFDSDSNCKVGDRKNNIRDNKCLLSLLGESIPDYLPQESVFKDNIIMWAPSITHVVKMDYGNSNWSQLQVRIRVQSNFISGIKEKNVMLISKTLEEIYSSTKITSLQSALQRIEAFMVKHTN